MSKLIFKHPTINHKYVTLGDTRFVFEDGKYIGKFKHD